jgi:Uma2 family endonuclease
MTTQTEIAIEKSPVKGFESNPFPIVLKINTKSWSDKEFYDFCQAHEELRFETDAEGDLIVMPPANLETSNKNSEINFQLRSWAKQDKTGIAFESDGMFILPNGAKKAPNAFWILRERYLALTEEERAEKFAPIAPDFVVELRSKSDRLKALQAKMQEYIENGVRLGWLIDPPQKRVYIYRINGEIQILENAEKVSGEDVLPGFELDLSEIW